MRLRDILIIAVGAILLLVGLFLMLSAVGLSFFGLTFINPIFSVIMGLIFLAIGFVIIRGGNISL